jgi:hypothetical protein
MDVQLGIKVQMMVKKTASRIPKVCKNYLDKFPTLATYLNKVIHQ